jgi:hypothetical protein
MHVWGVATMGTDADFIDNSQPGAFDFILYPGQEKQWIPGRADLSSHMYISLGGWAPA